MTSTDLNNMRKIFIIGFSINTVDIGDFKWEETIEGANQWEAFDKRELDQVPYTSYKIELYVGKDDDYQTTKAKVAAFLNKIFKTEKGEDAQTEWELLHSGAGDYLKPVTIIGHSINGTQAEGFRFRPDAFHAFERPKNAHSWEVFVRQELQGTEAEIYKIQILVPQADTQQIIDKKVNQFLINTFNVTHTAK